MREVPFAPIDTLEGTEEFPRFWTKETLHQVVERVLQGYKLIVVSNREPYVHRLEAGRVVCERPVSGLVTALEPVMRACGGTWIAHGSGNADREVADEHGRVPVPPEAPSYTLRRVWLSKEDEQDYYYGFANQALWPLCHIVFQRPLFRTEHWNAYRRVNRQFAEIILEEARDAASIVLIQDYHFALLPRMLREADSKLLIAQFWHIPWPNPEAFRICPWSEEILDGLLGNDLLGFHIRYHCQNFLETVAATLEARVDDEQSRISRRGQTTFVRPFPISLDIDAMSEEARSPVLAERTESLRKELGLQDQRVILGVDRIDYTKGIPERLRAFDQLLQKHPEYRGHVTFVQIGAPSRSHIPTYKALAAELDSLVADINWKYASGRWTPVVYLDVAHSAEEVLAFYRLADVCVVSALHDGMNLVAKEYVAARPDLDGVLVLSRFTGVARELEEAIQVNPYAVDELADALHLALNMDPNERRARMAALRDTVARNSIYRWAGKIVSAMGRIAARRRFEGTL
ncbi:MAG: trehalose-6-phosphate synthase [Candidatus Binatia bacterium]|nr:trehalose-6-phosphate synthase [Candidatus Binatia bacterium]